jgi:RNA polymerase sigma-70 factor (ECF subfamily)
VDAAPSRPPGLLELYDDALPVVYGYLLRRCGTREVAEDLTAEVWLAAVDAARGGDPPPVSVPWIVGVARHKLVDHYRREARRERGVRAVADLAVVADDPWEARLDAVDAHTTLARLAPQHRLVLTLRYVDDLPVPEVAALLGRTVHATEGLLARARAAFRRHHLGQEPSDG